MRTPPRNVNFICGIYQSQWCVNTVLPRYVAYVLLSASWLLLCGLLMRTLSSLSAVWEGSHQLLTKRKHLPLDYGLKLSKIFPHKVAKEVILELPVFKLFLSVRIPNGHSRCQLRGFHSRPPHLGSSRSLICGPMVSWLAPLWCWVEKPSVSLGPTWFLRVPLFDF
jgi:hypothetical protein